MTKNTLSKQYNRLADFLGKQEHIKLAYLFGSVAKGKAGKLSDIDIAVLLDETLDKKQRFDLQLQLIGDISGLLKTDKIDLVVINDAPLSLKFEIIKANCPLFVRDRMEKIDFEQMVMSRYLDRRYYEKRAASEFLEKVAVKGIQAAGFRNILVHMYEEVDAKKLHEYLQNNLEDFNEFAKFLARYLEKRT